jgi:hypothetical protein
MNEIALFNIDIGIYKSYLDAEKKNLIIMDESTSD